MVYRKGELSKGTMDRQWPHQLALPAARCTGGNYVTIHEFKALAGGSLLGPRQATSVPLAYGFFCGTYDVLMAAYFYTRRNDWQAAWSAGSAVTALRS